MGRTYDVGSLISLSFHHSYSDVFLFYCLFCIRRLIKYSNVSLDEQRKLEKSKHAG